MSTGTKTAAAIGTSANVSNDRGKGLGRLIEAAMSLAVEECAAEGITDPDKIRTRMLMARERIKKLARGETKE